MRFSSLLMTGVLSFATPSWAVDDEPGNAESLSSLSLSPDFYGTLIQNVSGPTLAAAQRSVLGEEGPRQVSRVRRDGVVQTYTANLDYRPSPGISRTLREQIAVKVAYADPQQAPDIRTALSNDSIWKRFGLLLSRSGLSARNLADVMTTCYISAWEIVHRIDAEPADKRAARDRIVETLKRSPEIMFMSDAEKQRSAEAFGILTAVSTAGSRSLLEVNDAVGYATLQYRVHEAFLRQGVDLKRLTLDRRGFVSG